MIRRSPFRILLSLSIVFALFLTGAVRADLRAPFEKLPPAFEKKVPDNINELKAIEEHLAALVERVMPAVVCVQVGGAFGSGVIVSKDGYILTAGHVSGTPNRKVKIYFHDGKTAEGKTLGGNPGIDSGLMKITTQGDWPYVEMGKSAELKKDQWCMVCAHPGGFKNGRTPPVRLGRLSKIDHAKATLTTECILVGGDSGGPLFDMHGRVIGINSRINEAINANMHVAIDPYRESWDKLVQGEVLGGKTTPYIGIKFDSNASKCLVIQVTPNSPAAKAGLKVDDVILKADDKNLSTGDALATLISQRTPGNKMTLVVQRGEEQLTLMVEIGKR
jgi:serine protease Do